MKSRSKNQRINEAAIQIDDLAHRAIRQDEISETLKALRQIRMLAADIAIATMEVI